jgi:lysophospholipase L1-like esterase
MTQPQSLPLGGTAAPQFDKLSPTTDLVTLGIGGNDIGLATDIEACLSLVPVDLPGQGCKAQFTSGGVDHISKAISATAPKITAVIAGVRQRSPHARIILVNYLDGIPLNGTGCWPIVPVPDTDMAYMAAKFQEMNAMIASVARASHVHLADTFTPTVGHDVCQAPTVRDIEGLVPLSTQNALLLAFPFHPNQSGANAQTQTVYASITHP